MAPFRCKILLVGASSALAAPIADLARSCQSDLELATDTDQALDRLADRGMCFVVCCLNAARDLSHVVQFVEHVSARRLPIPVVVITESSDPEVKLQVVRAGAVDCLLRPLNFTRLGFLLDLLTMRARYARPAPAPSSSLAELGDFLCTSGAMRQLVEKIRRVASLPTSILLTGETGTGKSHLARLIHDLSPRKSRPLVTMHCASMPSTLIESEMFGHRRGSFTGADRDHVGRFETAADGTLFLDEIDSLPLATQAKLLQVTEERVFEPIGSHRSVQVQARLVTATNCDLEQAVAAGRFRSDLFYRLNVVSFQLPALRERPGAIVPLARKFLHDFARRDRSPVQDFTPDAIDALEAYSWPGNVRELRNTIERALALCPGARIEVSDLPDKITSGAAAVMTGGDEPLTILPAPPEESSATTLPRQAAECEEGNALAQARYDAEYFRLKAALNSAGNNRTRAATNLGISRVTLYKKLRQYGLM